MRGFIFTSIVSFFLLCCWSDNVDQSNQFKKGYKIEKKSNLSLSEIQSRNSTMLNLLFSNDCTSVLKKPIDSLVTDVEFGVYSLCCTFKSDQDRAMKVLLHKQRLFKEHNNRELPILDRDFDFMENFALWIYFYTTQLKDADLMFKLSLGLKYSSNLDTTSEHLYNLTNSSLRFQRNPTDQNFNSLKEMNFDSVDYLQNWNWKKYLDALNEYNRSSNIENFYLEITNLINDGFLDQFLMKRLINILQSNDKGERYEAEVKELEEKYLEKYPSGCLPSRLLVSNSKFDNYVYECTKCIENGGQVDSIIATAYLVNHYVNNEILEDARILIDRYKKSQGGYHFNDLFYRREYGLFAIAELKYTFLDGNWEGMRKLAFGMKSNPIISKVNNEEDFIKLVGHIYYNYNSEDSDFLSFYERNF